MTNNTATLESGHNDYRTALPPRPIKTGEVAVTTSPQNENHAGKPELITHRNFITATSPVDSEISIIGGRTSTRLSENQCEPNEIEDHNQMVIAQVISEGGTFDEAWEALHNLFSYGSQHAPREIAREESDSSAFFRAVCGWPCEG